MGEKDYILVSTNKARRMHAIIKAVQIEKCVRREQTRIMNVRIEKKHFVEEMPRHE